MDPIAIARRLAGAPPAKPVSEQRFLDDVHVFEPPPHVSHLERIRELVDDLPYPVSQLDDGDIVHSSSISRTEGHQLADLVVKITLDSEEHYRQDVVQLARRTHGKRSVVPILDYGLIISSDPAGDVMNGVSADVYYFVVTPRMSPLPPGTWSKLRSAVHEFERDSDFRTGDFHMDEFLQNMRDDGVVSFDTDGENVMQDAEGQYKIVDYGGLQLT